MKTSKNKSRTIPCIVLTLLWLTGFGCESQTSIVDPLHIREAQIGEANFNPQPEPPPKVFEVELLGDPTGDWRGNFPGFREGRIQVQTLSSMERGRNIHVVQTWMVVPPEPIFPPEPIVPPDPIVPPEPVLISLKGIMNVANGNVVLNGMAEELGVHVHVRGQLMTLESGDISIGGELMFNPQPEPPPSPGISVPRGR